MNVGRARPGDVLIFAAQHRNTSISTPPDSAGTTWGEVVARDTDSNDTLVIYAHLAGDDEPDTYSYVANSTVDGYVSTLTRFRPAGPNQLAQTEPALGGIDKLAIHSAHLPFSWAPKGSLYVGTLSSALGQLPYSRGDVRVAIQAGPTNGASLTVFWLPITKDRLLDFATPSIPAGTGSNAELNASVVWI